MRASISHVTGDDHLDDPGWGNAPIWEGEVDYVAAALANAGLPIEQLVNGLDSVGTSWARDFLARWRG